MEPASLRPAAEDDLPAVLEIERQAYAIPWTEENFRTELEKPYSQMLVLTDDETDSKIFAYIVFWMMFDECQILNVAVAPGQQRQGLAKMMVRRVIGLASKKDVKKVILDVRKSNPAAIQLYHGLGFTITQVRKGFYSNGEDAYGMSLLLDQQPIDF